jgi:hypothetical protein
MQYDCVITFQKAKGIKAGDMGISSDPYIVANVDKLNFTTPIKYKTLNPVWDIPWFIQNLSFPCNLKMKVWDWDRFTEHDFLGEVDYILNDTLLSAPKDEVLDIKLNGKNKGQLFIQIKCQKSLVKRENASSKYHQCRKHSSHTAGVITGSEDGEGAKSFSCYEIDIHSVKNIFGDNFQHWNVNYDKAQMIFKESVASAMVRTGLKTQHASLYTSATHIQTYLIEKPDDIFQMLGFGLRGGVRRYFTYVLLDDVMRFSETGAAFFSDFMSKHAMHSNASVQVRFAGEFHIQKNDGKFKLVIDNNSGTYAPDKNLLPKLRELFETNFEGMIVEALDYKDPLWAQYKGKVEEENKGKK